MNGSAELQLNENNGLYEYGIFQEDSDYRVHVGPITKTIFVYNRLDMVEHIKTNTYKLLPAFQQGVSYPTAYGHAVPCHLDFIRPLYWHKEEWWKEFNINDNTTTKGNKAFIVVKRLMENGRFPFWITPKKTQDVAIEISGVDMTVSINLKIQVKCDFTAGPKAQGGTGNVFVQVSETNPKGMH
jgi:hypothetical protein